MLVLIALDVDRAGLRLFGLRWHLRNLSASYQKYSNAFTMLRSAHLACTGRFVQSLQIWWGGIIVFCFLIGESLYRIYALLRLPRNVPRKIRSFHLWGAGLAGLALLIAFLQL